MRVSVEEDSKQAVIVGRLCTLHHEVGDAFTVEHVWPSPMLQFETWQRLLNMPGVFVLTWDNCRYGEQYLHRQLLVTNLPCLAALAKDCVGGHAHLTIGFGTISVFEWISALWISGTASKCCAVCKTWPKKGTAYAI